MKQFYEKAAAAARKAAVLVRKLAVWLAPPRRLLPACLAAAFLISLLSWAVGDRLADAVLYFPSARGDGLKSELRALPRFVRSEPRAELVAAEVLLGPRNASLIPAFPKGSRVESCVYRKRILYLDLSEYAALADRPSLEKGLLALKKSLKATLPLSRRTVITIGGREPFADSLQTASSGSADRARTADGGDGNLAAKSEKKN
ncbi:MAG: GerMN domain-containing protein [Spirochaetaceae bacterium]|nr:GerMN domain-containing protein [Spirochaetaceae bacterium]